MKKILPAALLMLSAAASAASFNCKTAKTADEKAICANLSLNDKDVAMATKYQFLKGLFAMGGRGALQDSQQLWLKERHNCHADPTCLHQSYDNRLKQLDDVYAGINKPL